ncbi:MAG: NB-ARC domain-containing protein [Myxococcota bacterium]
MSAVAVVSIEDADQLWSRASDAMAAAAEHFDELGGSLLERFGGRRRRSPGVDFLVEFDDCADALGWSLQLQLELLEVEWPEDLLEDPAAAEVVRDERVLFRGLRVGIGVDLGILHSRVNGLSGEALSRGDVLASAWDAAAAARPGHVVLSPACVDAVAGSEVATRFVSADESGRWLCVVPAQLERRATWRRRERGPRDNLPSFSGEFIRRAREWEQVRRGVTDVRMAHLHGASGAGKTRLAVEFALAWLEGHPDREAWFCDLADLDRLSDALLEIARTTGVQIPRSESIGELEARLISAWSARGEVMLVLDDIGELVPEFGHAAMGWTEQVATLRLLSTARSRTDGEPAQVEVDALGRASAVALLRDRLINAAEPEPIEADMAELNRAVEDCGRLPLALELFAGSARRTQAGSLSEGAPVSLGSEARLDRALSRSWGALTPAEQSALRACTIFVGNFSVDAAIAVIESLRGGGVADDILQSLRHQSLVRSDGTSHGVKRLILLAPVREFIDKRVEPGDREEVANAHMRLFASWSQKLLEGLARGEEPMWIGRARDELGNLFRAADRAHIESPADAVDIMEALAALDKRIGSLGGFLERTEELVKAVRGTDDEALLFRALKVRADTYLWAGKYDLAEADFRRMLELAEGSGDETDVAYAESGLGFTIGTLGHEGQALPLVRGAIDAYADDTSYDAITVLTNAAIMVRHRNEIEETLDYLHRALSRARQRGSIFGQASVLMLMGSTLLYDEQYHEAIRYLEEADELFERIDDRRGQVVVYHELGHCYDAIGDVEMCDRCYQRAMGLAAAVGDREYVAISWLGRGRARFRRGEFAEAESDLLEASIMLGDDSQVHLKLGALLTLAATYGALERLPEAINYFDRVETVFEETDVTRERPTYEVLYGFLEYARARKALRSGDEDAAREFTESAWRRAKLDSPAVGEHTPAAERAVSRLESFLDEKTDAGELPLLDREGETTLRVDRDLSWFQIGDGERVDIRRRGAARRILGALVGRRLEAPGEAISTQELVDVGWPDEVLVPDSGARRIYMTISRMRDLGLEDVIETIDQGYRIDREFRVAWVE